MGLVAGLAIVLLSPHSAFVTFVTFVTCVINVTCATFVTGDDKWEWDW